MCWQYVTEVQVVDASGTEKSTCAHVLPVGLHNSENIPEDEEWTPISSSGETSSSPSVASMPSTTPRSKDLAAKIAYVTNIHVLLQFCFCLIHNSDMFFPFFPALDLLHRHLLLVVYDLLHSVFTLLLYLSMVLSSPNS
jgi:hypothetical protein